MAETWRRVGVLSEREDNQPREIKCTYKDTFTFISFWDQKLLPTEEQTQK